jgi:hypothetical protein
MVENVFEDVELIVGSARTDRGKLDDERRTVK